VLTDLALERAAARREPARAVELAKSALDRMPSYGRAWLALGAAEYRRGNNAAAVEALDKALNLGFEGQGPVPHLYRALAHARLGLAEEARRCLDRAHQAPVPPARAKELEPLWAEAEAAVGVPER
jgi:tetratricopeptide (TPR) repeat protein